MNKMGIDPGLRGAIAVLDENLKLITVFDMPVMRLSKSKNQVNAAELSKLIKDFSKNPVTAHLEEVHSMPGQGVSGVFSFGTSYGIVQGILAALGIPVVLVSPVRWKTRAGLRGKEKDMCRTLMQRLYPDAELNLKKHIGRADAIAIARFSE